MVQAILRGAIRLARSAMRGIPAWGGQEQVAADAAHCLPSLAAAWRLPEVLPARADAET